MKENDRYGTLFRHFPVVLIRVLIGGVDIEIHITTLHSRAIRSLLKRFQNLIINEMMDCFKPCSKFISDSKFHFVKQRTYLALWSLEERPGRIKLD